MKKSTYTITHNNNKSEIDLKSLYSILKEYKIIATFSEYTLIDIGDNINISINNIEFTRYKSELRNWNINKLIDDKDKL